MTGKQPIHTGRVDTINGFVAAIIEPVINGKGTVSAMMEDYLTEAWMELRGTNISLQQQKLLLEMARTVRRPDYKVKDSSFKSD